MTQETKISCYQKIYQELKEDPQITKLTYPEEKSNFDFFFYIRDVFVEYSLRNKIDLLTIKASKKFPGASDEDLLNKGRELTEGTKYLQTAYDETLVIQASIAFPNISDSDAERLIHTEAETFIEFIKGKVSELKMQSYDTSSQESGPEQPIFQDGNKQESHEMENLSVAVADIEKISAKPINNRINQPADEKNYKKKNVPSSSTTREDVLMDAFSVMEQTTDEKKESDPEKVELNSAFSSDEQNAQTPFVRNRQKLRVSKFEKRSAGSAGRKTFANNQEAGAESIPSKPAEDIRPMDNAAGMTMHPTVSEQMKKMYEDMDRVFDMRKKQLDYREETLNRKNDYLIKIQTEIEQQRSNFEKEKEGWQSSHDELVNLRKDAEEKQENIRTGEQALQEKMESLDLRQKALDEKETSLANRESECKRRMDSVKLREQSAGDKAKNNEKRFQELKVQQESLKEKEKKLDEDRSEFELLKAQLQRQQENLKLFEESLRQKENDVNERAEMVESSEQSAIFAQESSDEMLSLKEEVNRLTLENAQLSEDLEKMSAELEAESNSGESLQEDLEKISQMEQENEELNNTIESLKQEAVENEKKYKESEAFLLESKEELSKKLSKAKAKIASLMEREDPQKKAVAIKEGLKQIGVDVELVTGSGELILAGEKNGCTICINPIVGMLYIEKDVRRGAKFQNVMEGWNQASIRESYMFTAKKVYCKRVYTSIVKDVDEVLRRFDKMK